MARMRSWSFTGAHHSRNEPQPPRSRMSPTESAPIWIVPYSVPRLSNWPSIVTYTNAFGELHVKVLKIGKEKESANTYGHVAVQEVCLDKVLRLDGSRLRNALAFSLLTGLWRRLAWLVDERLRGMSK